MKIIGQLTATPVIAQGDGSFAADVNFSVSEEYLNVLTSATPELKLVSTNVTASLAVTGRDNSDPDNPLKVGYKLNAVLTGNEALEQFPNNPAAKGVRIEFVVTDGQYTDSASELAFVADDVGFKLGAEGEPAPAPAPNSGLPAYNKTKDELLAAGGIEQGSGVISLPDGTNWTPVIGGLYAKN
jgi:hypothetical protein